MADKTICPVCKNKVGFAFGTCIECGYNHLDDSFHFIKVHIDDLPEGEYKERLIEKHWENVLKD